MTASVKMKENLLSGVQCIDICLHLSRVNDNANNTNDVTNSSSIVPLENPTVV